MSKEAYVSAGEHCRGPLLLQRLHLGQNVSTEADSDPRHGHVRHLLPHPRLVPLPQRCVGRLALAGRPAAFQRRVARLRQRVTCSRR